MNYISFVQLDDTLALNPGHITRVQFRPERVTVHFIDGESITLISEQHTKFIDWWTHQAIVVSNDDSDDGPMYQYIIRGQRVPEAPEM